MWIQVRTIDGSQTRTIEDVSRKATIEELRERVWALFDVRPECQRLFYRGKQVRRPGGEAGGRAGPATVRPAGGKAGVQGPGNLAVLGRGTAATGVACEVPGCLSSRAWGEGVIGAGKGSGLGGAAVPGRRRDELALLARLACFAPLLWTPRCGMKSEAPSPCCLTGRIGAH